MLDPKLFEAEIRKTGFVLENRVAQELKANGWTVISNKYYVDDSSDETVREIDLVAYKSTKVQRFDVYTTLIISCKKSDANAWALLARDVNLKDPNSDFWPLHAWSNDKAINFKLNEEGKAKTYHEAMLKAGVTDVLSTPKVEVFAFQEMDKASGRPQNDKPIFSALTSLMKAQAYELAALPTRKKNPCIYQFNLLSVVEADLLRLMFSGTKIDCTPITTEHYLSRYIVRKRENFSRIRFLQADAFAPALEDYSRLHKANCQWFGAECDAFYAGAIQDYKRNGLYEEQFVQKVRWPIYSQVESKLKLKATIKDVTFFQKEDTIIISSNLETKVMDFLNADEHMKTIVAKVLLDVYRYEGEFRFDDDIPF